MILELPQNEIGYTLNKAGIPVGSIFLGDTFYALPTEKWVQEPFARQFEHILSQTGFNYQAERRDCENFAQWAAAWANQFHAETGKPGPECGLAFGEMWVGSLEHAMNFAIHRDPGDNLYVAAYEPQLSARGWAFTPRQLTRADYESVWLCKA